MNETIQTLLQRRSIRAFGPQQVREEQLAEILEAGLYAPSGKGAQAVLMVVVQEAETISVLSRMNAAVMNAKSDPFFGAPTVVVVLADSSVMTHVEDGSLVLGNLMNAAWSLGVGSCWIHRAKQVFDGAAGQELLRHWGVPEGYVGVGHCILGYREGDAPAPAPRKAGRVVYVR